MNIDKPLDRPLGHRDAFHVPSIVVSAKDFVRGGDKVKIDDNFNASFVRDGGHGIVNPFAEHIPPGEKFYVFLYPGLVHNLVHSFDVDGLRKPDSDVVVENVRRDKDELGRENARLKNVIKVLEQSLEESNASLQEVKEKLKDANDELDNLGECGGCY